MRASDVYDQVIAAIEAIEVDNKARKSDVFRHDPDQTDGEARPERSFIIAQGPLSPATTFAPQVMATTLRLIVSYNDAPGVSTRMAMDGERVIQTLQALHGGDLYSVEDLGDWIPTEGFVEGQIDCQIDFRLRYQLTGV